MERDFCFSDIFLISRSLKDVHSVQQSNVEERWDGWTGGRCWLGAGFWILWGISELRHSEQMWTRGETSTWVRMVLRQDLLTKVQIIIPPQDRAEHQGKGCREMEERKGRHSQPGAWRGSICGSQHLEPRCPGS